MQEVHASSCLDAPKLHQSMASPAHGLPWCQPGGKPSCAHSPARSERGEPAPAAASGRGALRWRRRTRRRRTRARAAVQASGGGGAHGAAAAAHAPSPSPCPRRRRPWTHCAHMMKMVPSHNLFGANHHTLCQVLGARRHPLIARFAGVRRRIAAGTTSSEPCGHVRIARAHLHGVNLRPLVGVARWPAAR